MTTIRAAKSAFRYAIRLGTGRAYLVAQAHPEVDFSAYIMEAALQNFAYDGQSAPSEYVMRTRSGGGAGGDGVGDGDEDGDASSAPARAASKRSRVRPPRARPQC